MKRYHGLTLVELVVTLAVAIVMLAVGIPMFQGMQERSRATSQANRLITAIQLARSEALGRGVPVSVCAIDDPAVDTDKLTCGNLGTDWENGWMVFEGSGNTPTAAEQIRVFEDLDAATVGLTQTASTAALRFLSTGVMDDTVHAGREFVRLAYPNTGASDRCITIGLAGGSKARTLKSDEVCP